MLVDGGYLSFKLAFGNYDWWEYQHSKDISLFALDSWNIRSQDQAEYKETRGTQLEIVTDLRRRILYAETLPVCKIEGLEADDLVACCWLFNQDQIIGVDKDYFVLPGLKEVHYHTLQPYTRDGYLKKLSGVAREVASQDFVLYQVLFGDSIDRIPRLLAKGNKGKEQVNKVMSNGLIDVFGDAAIVNLKSVLFPHYSKINDTKNWFEEWSKGTYWSKDNWTAFYDEIQSKKTKVVKEIWRDLF